jgi:hypothetical protein
MEPNFLFPKVRVIQVCSSTLRSKDCPALCRGRKPGLSVQRKTHTAHLLLGWIFFQAWGPGKWDFKNDYQSKRKKV